MIQDLDDQNAVYAVMPYLRPFDSPMFEIVDDLVDFIDQTLEVLAFQLVSWLRLTNTGLGLYAQMRCGAQVLFS